MSRCDDGEDNGDKVAQNGANVACMSEAICGNTAPDTASLIRATTFGKAYFFAGACGCDGGTVSISLPENTGAEVGWPFGEPPACSMVTA